MSTDVENVDVAQAYDDAADSADSVVPEAPERDLTKERDDNCVPLAIDILQAIGDFRPKFLGSSLVKNDDEAIKYYAGFATGSIVPLFKQYNVKLIDIPYVFQIVLQAISLVRERLEFGIESIQDRADAYLWGVSDVSDVTFNKLMQVVSEIDRNPEGLTTSNPQDDADNNQNAGDNVSYE